MMPFEFVRPREMATAERVSRTSYSGVDTERQLPDIFSSSR